MSTRGIWCIFASVRGKGNVVNEGSGKLVFKRKRGGPVVKEIALKPVEKRTTAGKRTILRLKFIGGEHKRRRLTRSLKHELRAGQLRIRLLAQVELTDEAGNSVTERRLARLKLRR